MRASTSLLLFVCLAFGAAGPSRARDDATEESRKTIWDLALGAPVAAQPDPSEFHGYACGGAGGPPRKPIGGFADFRRCPPEAGGWREVYFEYDDELEYIARARNLEDQISRFAGTVERGFPVIVSALFDDAGVLRGIRLATDARPDFRRDPSEADIRKRSVAYQFGGVMAAKFDIDAERDCVKSPPGEGESAVGGIFVKLDCGKTDIESKRAYRLSVRFLRKPGQSGRDPRTPTKLTTGQFESFALLDISAPP